MLFGFTGNDDMIIVLNYCILITKYYVNIQNLINNNMIDFYNYFPVEESQQLVFTDHHWVIST